MPCIKASMLRLRYQLSNRSVSAVTCFGVGLPVMVRECEGAEQILKFGGTVDRIIIPVGDQGEFVEGQTDREQRLCLGKIISRIVHPAWIVAKTIHFGLG